MRFKQFLTEAAISQFPQDFEQVLNFIVGGNWTLSSNDWIDGYDIQKQIPVIMGMGAEYRGMSESGHHYTVEANLMDENHADRNSASHTYDPKMGDPAIKFALGNIAELGQNFQAFGKSHASLLYTRRSDEFFNTAVEMAKKVKQILEEHESNNNI
jgi:hypothetical protein